jgi:hypothetical protein
MLAARVIGDWLQIPLWLPARTVRGTRGLSQDVPIATGSLGKQLQVSIIVPLSDMRDGGRGLTNLRGRGKHHRSAHHDHCQSKNLKEKQSARTPVTGSASPGRLVATGGSGFVGKTYRNSHGSLLSGYMSVNYELNSDLSRCSRLTKESDRLCWLDGNETWSGMPDCSGPWGDRRKVVAARPSRPVAEGPATLSGARSRA